MVNFCAVYGCGNKGGRDGTSFFRFPAVNLRFSDEAQSLQKKRRQTWISAIKREDLTAEKCEYSRVCSDHFLSGKPAELFDTDHPDWVPSKQLGYKKKTASNSLKRYERLNKRYLNKQVPTYVEEPAERLPDDQENVILQLSDKIKDNSSQTFLQTSSSGVQTDLTCDMLKQMEEELRSSNLEKYKLQERVQSYENSQEDLERDTAKCAFYTGLPSFTVLMLVLSEISPFLNFTATSVLTKFDQLLLTLMKLRLNLSLTDLSYRFRVSRRTATRTFNSVLDVLYLRLYGCVFWPDREMLRKTMPVCFKDVFGDKVTIIIDCFEIVTEKPSNLLAQCQTWSSYKSHQTVKFLIGICPQGAISFISQGWGGRVSDRIITQECGILSKLWPGDVILADRGFNVAEDVGLYYATINIPAFTKGKHQLYPKEVEETRKIASVRIHVERVIGVLRQKYRILMGPIPTEMLSATREDVSVLDKIVRVCSSLTNLCKSVIPFE